MSTATPDTVPLERNSRATDLREIAAGQAPAATGAEPRRSGEEAPTRVYRARTVEELIPKIQAELGADAIVVRRQKGLTGGIAGFFQRPFVEIEARAGTPRVDLYDEQDGAAAFPAPLAEPQMPAALPPRGVYPSDPLAPLSTEPSPPATTPQEALQQLLHAGADAFREPHEAGLIERAANGGAARESVQERDPFAAALAEAEAAVQPEPARPLLTPTPSSTPASPPSQMAAANGSGLGNGSRSQGAPVARGRARSKIESSLLGYGLGEALVRELIETAAGHVLPLMPARSSLASAVHRTLSQRIPWAPPLPVGSATIALVGPGGSGKTACCAALLEAYRERSTLPAACATIVPGATRGELQALIAPHVLEPTPLAAAPVAAALGQAREEGLLLLDLPALSPADRGSIRTLCG